MFSESDFQSWCQALHLPAPAKALISQIRSADPARRVRSKVGNVSGFYPSRKMNRTIQFESHRNELATLLEMEHDPDVCEFYDQPLSIQFDAWVDTGSRPGRAGSFLEIGPAKAVSRGSVTAAHSSAQHGGQLIDGDAGSHAAAR